MIAANELLASPCCIAVIRFAGTLASHDGTALGLQSASHLRHRCPVRPPHAGRRIAALEPARRLRPHQGAGGRLRRDAVRTHVVRDVADAVGPAPARGIRADHRRRRASQALRPGAPRRTHRQAEARHRPRAVGPAHRRLDGAGARALSADRARARAGDVERRARARAQRRARRQFLFRRQARARSREHRAARCRLPRDDAGRVGRRARRRAVGRPRATSVDRRARRPRRTADW